MANKKKAKEQTPLSQSGSRLRSSLRAFPWKRLGLFLLVFLPVCAVYYVCVALEWRPVLPVYFALTLISGVVYAVYNRGLMGALPKKEALNQSWDDEKKEAFLSEAARRKEKSFPLLLVFLAFLTVFFIEAVIMTLDTISSGAYPY